MKFLRLLPVWFLLACPLWAQDVSERRPQPVTASACASTAYDTGVTPNSGLELRFGDTGWAYPYTATSSVPVCSIDIDCWRVGTSANTVQVKVYADDSFATLIASSATKTVTSIVSTASPGATETFTFSVTWSQVNGTKYWVAYMVSASDNSNYPVLSIISSVGSQDIYRYDGTWHDYAVRVPRYKIHY